MKLLRPLLALCALLLLVAADAGAAQERLVEAHYAAPVQRYGHFALGRPHEYARLTATTEAGHELAFELPPNEVFEDLAPRLVSLAPGEPPEILAIVSSREGGSRLVLIRLRGARLEISAQSRAIGTPMRWLNPVAVADLDGDAHAEIAAVITPHIGGTLKVYRRQGAELLEVAALGGFSNHVYGTTQLALSASLQVAGKTHLLVPDATRRQLRLVALENDRLVETGRCLVPAPVTGPIRVLSPTQVSIGLLSGPHMINRFRATPGTRHAGCALA